MKFNTKRADTRAQNGVCGWLNLELESEYSFSGEKIIIARLLERRIECRAAFMELRDSIENYQWQQYLQILIRTANIWNSEEIERYRGAENQINELNSEIVSLSSKLKVAFIRRRDLCEKNGFDTETIYHVLDLLELAAGENSMYEHNIVPIIRDNTSGFDMKYWPSIEEIVTALNIDAQSAKCVPTSNITREAIRSRKKSKRDCLRAFNEAIRQNTENNHGAVPDDFRLSSNLLADLLNVCFDNLEDSSFKGADVKSARSAATIDCV